VTQAAGQADPTSNAPINFTATFGESVSGFSNGDVVVSGTAGGTKTVAVTGGPTVYNVAVSGMTTTGTVIVAVPAGAATDPSGNASLAATVADGTVNWVQDTIAATCSYQIVAGPPKHIDFTVQDVGSGLSTIVVTTANNIVLPVPIPAFTSGVKTPVTFTATKDDQTKGAQIAIVITDVAGNQSSCI
jgi:hypothetical protein